MQVTSSQLKTALMAAIGNNLSVLITGKPGVGKTEIVGEAVREADADFIVSHPAVEDPTVPAGLPWAFQGSTEATFLPFGNTARVLKATKRTIWMLEDFGQATPATQAAYMQFLLGGALNGHTLPSSVTMMAATNGRADRSGVSGILEAVKSRFDTILELIPDVDSWCANYAIPRNIPPIFMAFLRYRPELLSDFKPTADMTNSPSPRTWAKCAKWEPLNLPQQVELATMAGVVGEGAAAEFLAFRRMFQSLTSVDAILLDPKGVKLPTAPNELYATCTALASKATEQNLTRIGVYASRLMDASRGEFAVLLMRDCIRRNQKLTFTDAFIRISSGPLGQLISGQENN
jgi:hypothetical protein